MPKPSWRSWFRKRREYYYESLIESFMEKLEEVSAYFDPENERGLYDLLTIRVDRERDRLGRATFKLVRFTAVEMYYLMPIGTILLVSEWLLIQTFKSLPAKIVYVVLGFLVAKYFLVAP